MKLNNKYFLLRHGQTIYQKEDRKMIYYDNENASLEITKEGKERIKEQAEKLKEYKIDLIFSSPYLRVKQTAEIVSKATGRDIIYDERLVDIKMGEFSGKPTSVYKDFFVVKKLGFTQRPLDGENWKDVSERVESFLNDVENKYQGKNILVISHGEPLWLMAGFLNGLKTLDELLPTRKSKNNNLYPKVGDLIVI